MSKKVKRLFEQFAPASYDIQLSIAPDKKSFTGKVVINGIKKGRPAKRITLHQKELKITKTTIQHTDKKKNVTDIPIKRTVLHSSYDEIRLHTDKDIYAGSYQIILEFSGTITKNMEGVYPCFYEEDGNKKELVATQFESHHAREAFPCIDEPEAKAVFTLSLEHSTNEIALSNTPLASSKKFDERQTSTFEQTPIMSTYLLAFVVGELSYKETRSKNNVLIRTYATKNQIEHTSFALDIASKCMDFYEDYYDIPFPLEKCDFVALPDFASGAMENWGLITFREQTLLCDEQNTSLSTKQYVAIVVAHELTHQWFGNLVTMRWWTDLWLNEGFASWMEYLAIDHFYPEWHLWTQFAVDDQQLALKLDSLEHTHPIEVTINHPDEIRTIFDAISYQKGASVIHMLHNYLGPEPFRDGLRHYLKKHSYKNTDTVDLWQALEDITKKPVKDFMHAWTSQTGFPVVEVTQEDTHLHMSQKRFITNPASKKHQDNSLWPIPLLAENLSHQIVHKKATNVNTSQPETFLKLNSGQTGFYRVNYSHAIQQRQTQALDKKLLSSIDRMGLLADSIEVTKAGYQPVTEFLDLLGHYKQEDSLAVWEIISNSIGAIRATLSKNDKDDNLRDIMKPFIHELVADQVKTLGWDKKKDESHLETLLRPLILGMATGADEPDTVKKALELYKQKIDNDTTVDPDLRSIIYATAMRKNPAKAFNELLDIYKNTSSSDEKLSITAALTCSEDTKVHDKVLALITTDTVRLQDTSYWIAYSFMNRHGRKNTWKWLQENWDWLRKNLGGDLSFSRMPLYSARSFADKTFLKEYTAFFEKHMEPMLERSYKQGLEIVETNTAWRARDAEKAYEWFKKAQ